VEWNRKLDLTAARDAQTQLEVLLADALMLANPAFVPQGARVLTSARMQARRRSRSRDPICK
jgi:hypothetical protein